MFVSGLVGGLVDCLAKWPPPHTPHPSDSGWPFSQPSPSRFFFGAPHSCKAIRGTGPFGGYLYWSHRLDAKHDFSGDIWTFNFFCWEDQLFHRLRITMVEPCFLHDHQTITMTVLTRDTQNTGELEVHIHTHTHTSMHASVIHYSEWNRTDKLWLQAQLR